MVNRLNTSNLTLDYFDKIATDEADNIGKKYFPIDDKVFHLGYLEIRETLSYDLKNILGYVGVFYLIGNNFYRETTSFTAGTWNEMKIKINKIEDSFKILFKGLN